MTIRTVLPMLEGDKTDVIDLAAVGQLVRNFPVHVDLLHVRRDWRNVMPMVGEGISADLIDTVQRQVETEESATAARCRDVFDRWRSGENIPEVEEAAASEQPSARMVDVTGNSGSIVATMGKMVDLVVLPAPSLEAAIYDTGRPVLFSPRKELATMGKRVAVFWNDTAESSRAAKAVMPFLKQADMVQICSVDDDSVDAETLEAFAKSLAWYGITASVRMVEPDGRSAGEALIDAAWEMEADLIAMGAFSHSRLREMILGGVTRHILQVAGRPVLMMH